MNVGPGGFAHAPVSKAFVLAAVGSSVIANAAQGSHRRLPPPLVSTARALAFPSPGALLFGCFLLYHCRVLERQSGSRQYGSFAALVTGIAAALQLALRMPLAPAPLPLVFAALVPFSIDVPAGSSFNVLGASMTDKSFVWLLAGQLLLSSGRHSLIAAAAGLVAGLLHRANVLSMRRFRLPAALCQAIGSLFGPLLLDARHAGPSIVLSSGAPDTGGAPGHPGSGAGAGPAAGFAEGFYDAARGSSGGGAGSGAGAAAGAGAGPAGAAAALPPAPEALESLLSMGFPRDQAVAALQQAGNDLQMAIALLVG